MISNRDSNISYSQKESLYMSFESFFFFFFFHLQIHTDAHFVSFSFVAMILCFLCGFVDSSGMSFSSVGIQRDSPGSGERDNKRRRFKTSRYQFDFLANEEQRLIQQVC
jgi:hypothetical protein